MIKLNINDNSNVPRYQQIIDSISKSIDNGELKEGDKIPSLNVLSKEYHLAKDTVVKAFNRLKELGILSSAHGKGFYINNKQTRTQHNIFLLFDEYTPYKEDLFNSINKHIGHLGKVDIYFHHYNIKAFEDLITSNIGNHTAYVIIPFANKDVPAILKKIPQDKLYILDVPYLNLDKIYPSVCQDFELDIINALKSGFLQLKRYEKINLVFPTSSHHPNEILDGFRSYCQNYKFKQSLINTDIEEIEIKKRNAYITLVDRDLVDIIQRSKAKGYKIGKDIGIISYNDTPLKKVVSNGITSISTDFEKMGESMAKIILNKEKKQIKTHFRLINRASL